MHDFAAKPPPSGTDPAAHEPQIASIGHVGLFVDDLERSLEFYRDVLGLTVTDRDDRNGMIFLSSRPEEEHHEFLLCRGRTAPRDVQLLQQVSFRCHSLLDVIAFYQRLAARGTEFDRIVSHGNAIGVYFFDPDHNRLELYWPTGLKAKQTYLQALDLSKPVAEIMREVEESVRRYAETGFVDPRFLRN